MRLAVNGPRRAQGELTIGIVGPHELVERIMLSGTWASGKDGACGPGPPAPGGRLWRRSETSVAFTCMQSVAQKLSATGVPVFILRPTGSDIRSALRTAALLGGYRRLEDAQLALALVEVPALRDTGRRGSPRQSREEMRLTVHRFLVQEAQRIHAAVSPTSDHGFLIVATRGSLARATDGFRSPPFAERARSDRGITIDVGIGMGRTAVEAEAHARAALVRAQSGGGMAGIPPGPGGA